MSWTWLTVLIVLVGLGSGLVWELADRWLQRRATAAAEALIGPERAQLAYERVRLEQARQALFEQENTLLTRIARAEQQRDAAMYEATRARAAADNARHAARRRAGKASPSGS